MSSVLLKFCPCSLLSSNIWQRAAHKTDEQMIMMVMIRKKKHWQTETGRSPALKSLLFLAHPPRPPPYGIFVLHKFHHVTFRCCDKTGIIVCGGMHLRGKSLFLFCNFFVILRVGKEGYLHSVSYFKFQRTNMAKVKTFRSRLGKLHSSIGDITVATIIF